MFDREVHLAADLYTLIVNTYLASLFDLDGHLILIVLDVANNLRIIYTSLTFGSVCVKLVAWQLHV